MYCGSGVGVYSIIYGEVIYLSLTTVVWLVTTQSFFSGKVITFTLHHLGGKVFYFTLVITIYK